MGGFSGARSITEMSNMTCSIFCICQILKRYIFYHFTETCGSYPAHDVYNFHDVCKDRVVYPYFMPILILILSVVFGSLRHLLVIISPYSMSTVIYFHYINLSIFRVVVKVKNLGLGVGTKGKPPYNENNL